MAPAAPAQPAAEEEKAPDWLSKVVAPGAGEPAKEAAVAVQAPAAPEAPTIPEPAPGAPALSVSKTAEPKISWRVQWILKF